MTWPEREEWVSQWPAASLASLPGCPRSITARKACSGQQVQHESPLVAHLDHLLLAEGEMAPGGTCADIAGHEDRGRHLAGRGHVERAFQGIPQRPGAIGANDARGAQDRQSAFDPQPRIEGLGGNLPSAGHADFHADAARR